jgi:hypothetical protein
VVVNWKSPAATEPGLIVTDEINAVMGSRWYNKRTGRLCQYGIWQQMQAIGLKGDVNLKWEEQLMGLFLDETIMAGDWR